MAFLILHHFGAETDICLQETSKTTPVNLYRGTAPTLHSRKAPGWRPATRLRDPSWCFWQNGLLALKMVAWIEISGLGDTVILLMATRNPANAPVEVGSWNPIIKGFKYPRWLFRISEPSTASTHQLKIWSSNWIMYPHIRRFGWTCFNIFGFSQKKLG